MKCKLKKENKPTLATFGKYKAVASHRQTIETKQILKEVCENNPISEGVVTAVVWKLAQVIKRHLREGDKQEWEAAGHCAAYHFDGEDIFICHGYSATQNGAAMLIQRPISWTADGWPELKP